MAQPAQALAFLEPGLEQARRSGDIETELGAMGMSGLAHKDLAEFAQAQAILTEAIDLARQHDLTIFELSPSDESLESVFAYLVAR